MSDQDTEIDDGGPAFPNTAEGSVSSYTDWTGMSLRAYYAGLAMQGMAVVFLENQINACEEESALSSMLTRQAMEIEEEPEYVIAGRCVELADALIRALKGGG